MTSPACSRSGSKSTSQIHETSCPSAIASLSATTRTGGTPVSSVRTTSFAPAGFLMRRRTTDLPPAGIRSKRPNAALNRSSPARTSSSDAPTASASAAAVGRVVDVVEPGQAELHARRTVRRHEVEARRLEAAELDVARGDVELGAAVPADRAAVVAEVTDVRGRELVRRAAANAVLRVGGVLQLRAGMSWIVEPEANRTWPSVGEVRDDGVVRVDDERRLRRHRRDRGTPALGDDLELAVAIELVAEEVAERDDPRSRSRDRFGKRSFVDLEQPELRLARRRRAPTRFRRAGSRRHGSTRGGDSRPRISAAIAVVVVFPFVADISATPSEAAPREHRRHRDRASRAPSRESSCRRRVSRHARGRRARVPVTSRERAGGPSPASVATGEEERLLWRTCRLRRTL